MEHLMNLRRLVCVCISVVLGGVVATQTAFAQAPSKGTIIQMDRVTLREHFKHMGYKTRQRR